MNRIGHASHFPIHEEYRFSKLLNARYWDDQRHGTVRLLFQASHLDCNTCVQRRIVRCSWSCYVQIDLFSLSFVIAASRRRWNSHVCYRSHGWVSRLKNVYSNTNRLVVTTSKLHSLRICVLYCMVSVLVWWKRPHALPLAMHEVVHCRRRSVVPEVGHRYAWSLSIYLTVCMLSWPSNEVTNM